MLRFANGQERKLKRLKGLVVVVVDDDDDMKLAWL
jgi:hypothetical protein